MPNIPLIIHDASSAARVVEKSDAWGRLAFKSGEMPTEILINGKRPAITDATLARLAPGLKGRRSHKAAEPKIDTL